MPLLVRLSRIVPVIIGLAVLAFIIYFVVTFRHSPNKAKSILIRLFTWITGILSGFFTLVTLYAVYEKNIPVIELAASLLIVSLVGLIAVRIYRAVFIRRNPAYKDRPSKTTVEDKRSNPFWPPWKR